MDLLLGSKEPLKGFQQGSNQFGREEDGWSGRKAGGRERREGLQQCAGRGGSHSRSSPGGKGLDTRDVKEMEWPDSETDWQAWEMAEEEDRF